jgi:hypothetical protein
MRVSIARLTLFLALAASPLQASEGHNHEAAVEPAPHGGILRDSPPYKTELVIEGESAKVYVYDKGLKLAPLAATELKGALKFPKERKDKPVTFRKAGDFFEARIPGIGKVHRFDLHVTLTEAGKKTVMDFGIDNIH